ncbi:esterase-like activity of phytase family protein [Maricaulis sp.]|uniref:esterase-like activity of phytase family protein n=1 Tax=Maricaulis sp. TaxID=1486257 RepID=UPI003A91ED9F
MKRHLLVLTALLAAACSHTGEPRTPVADLAPGSAPAATVRPVPLFKDAPGTYRIGSLEWRGGLEISHDDARFGGLSAIIVSGDGSRLLSISDSAWWVTSRLGWAENGHLTGFDTVTISTMRDENGEHLEGNRNDSEGLAALGDGRYAVSFEREHRIWAYDIGTEWDQADAARPVPVTGPAPADPVEENGGMEALASLGDGGLLTGFEYPLGDNADYNIWHRAGQDWQATAMAALPEYGLTGMTVIEDQVYALERFYSPAVGNRIRIIRFAEADLGQDAVIEPEILAELGPENSIDNFEGITAFRRGEELILLIVSDDNYRVHGPQRTLLMAFAVAG